jgi:hypothetical protein
MLSRWFAIKQLVFEQRIYECDTAVRRLFFVSGGCC